MTRILTEGHLEDDVWKEEATGSFHKAFLREKDEKG